MTRKKFSPEEMKPIRTYPEPKTHMFKYVGLPQLPPDHRMDLPITPKENFKLALSGKKPYWIPRVGWMCCDVQIFRPRFHPDNVATRIIFDAEEPIVYTGTKTFSSWFDLEWEFSEVAGGATVHPGNPKVPDIENWEKYISIPNLDDMDFETSARINREFLNTDKLNELGILSGLWERLMSLMDVDNAAIAMIDEDQQEGVHRLFDQLTELIIGYIRRMKQHNNIDDILIHDDWGHQHSTFFSIDTCREMLIPYYKRIIDVVHELGMYFHLHSCGKNQTLVPAMLEAGVDMWCPQDMNDFEMLTQTYKDKPIVFGLIQPPLPEDAGPDELRSLARQWVDKYKDCRVATYFKAAPPEFSSAVYEFSRKAYENLD